MRHIADSKSKRAESTPGRICMTAVLESASSAWVVLGKGSLVASGASVKDVLGRGSETCDRPVSPGTQSVPIN